MKKRLFLFCLFVTAAIGASAQYFQWAKIENKISGYEEIKSLACGTNFIATTGIFQNTVTLGNQTFTCAGYLNSYLAIHDQAGKYLWAKQIFTPYNYAPNVTVDYQNNIIISSVFIDSIKIDGTVLKGQTGNSFSLYVAKFSPSGTLLWLRASNSSFRHQYYEANKVRSVVTDQAGNIFMAGEFNTTLTFNGSLISSGTNNAFVVKYDANGVFQWAMKTPNQVEPLELDVKLWVAPNGNIYLTKYNEDRNPSNKIRYLSIECLSNNGQPLWNKKINYANNLGQQLAFDPYNNAYLTGAFINSITFGNKTLSMASLAQFMTKIDALGNVKWAKTIITKHPSGTDSLSFFSGNRIFFSPTNEIGIAGGIRGTAYFKGVNGITLSTPSSPHSFVAKFDTAGTALWANQVTGAANFNYDLTGDPTGNLYISGLFLNGNSLQFSNTTLTAPTTSGGYYLAKIINEANSLSGSAFLDMNKNWIKEANEEPFDRIMLETIPGPFTSLTAPDGAYNFYLSTGNYNVSVLNPPKYYTVTPTSHNVAFSGINQAHNGKDFALQPVEDRNDVRVIITEFIRARPGFNSKYRLTIHNAGTTVLSDTLKFSYDSNILTFITASAAPLSQGNGAMAWYYQNLRPNETRNIDLTFSVPATTVLGTPLTAKASIKPIAIDLYQPDNDDTLKHLVVGSYDPNDKKVNKPEISPAAAAAGEYLDYTIRFQNTGTDTAFTVIVTDQIREGLQLNTFEMLAASHPFKLKLQNNNILEWRFENILLPDSNRNEPKSHGFVRFRIKTKPGLISYDSVWNQAAIYFDFNVPVITNLAVTRVVPNKIPNQDINLLLYPNPANNYVIIAANLIKHSSAKVRLINILGQQLVETILPANQQLHYKLPLNNLPKGVYIVQLETEAGRQTQRLVIQ